MLGFWLKLEKGNFFFFFFFMRGGGGRVIPRRAGTHKMYEIHMCTCGREKKV